MRIYEKNYNLEFTLSETETTSITIENPRVFREIVSSIWKSICGEDTSIILSEGVKELKISKSMECIFNPLSLEINSRKILNKLYADLSIILNEELQEETLKLKAQILKYIDRMEEKIDYALTSDIDFDITEILKIYHVRLVEDQDTMLENLIHVNFQ